MGESLFMFVLLWPPSLSYERKIGESRNSSPLRVGAEGRKKEMGEGGGFPP